MSLLYTKRAVAVCAAALCVALVSGCTSNAATSTLTEEQQANRTYMADVNLTMESLGADLEKFNDSVARKDIVSMRVQADNAFKTLDRLSALTVPEALSDVHQSYVSGANSMKEALTAYINLYAEIESASEQAPFDWSTYDQRVAAIQQRYDEGIAALKSGDEAAAAKE